MEEFRSGLLSAIAIPTLIVEPGARDRAFLVETLSAAGVFSVSAVDSFARARASLEAHPPLLLITEACLGAYQGIHLAILGRHARPEMRLMFTSRYRAPQLERDSRALGASFLLKPLTTAGVLASLYTSALSERHPSFVDDWQSPWLEPRGPEWFERGPRFDASERRLRRRRREIVSYLMKELARR